MMIVGITVLTACHSVRHGEPIAGPSTSTDPKIERGRIAFAQYCSQCHPRGEGGLGPALNNKALPGFLIKCQVRLGLGVMPDFVIQHLPPDKLDDIVAYLAALRHTRKEHG
jgi:mono/diheme cytochrome c family protein